MDQDTHLHLSLATPFVAEEHTVMRKYMRSKRLGKSGLKAEKELNSSRLGLFRPNPARIWLP
jgi:hypothetical protein